MFMPVSQEEKIKIHPTAIISPEAKISSGVEIGPYVIIEGNTEIGPNCKLLASCCIGFPPQDITYKGEPTGVKIGEGTVIREYVTIHRACKEGFTTIGKNCYLMNYVHAGHNCQVGDNVIMANAATLGGYVTVEDFVFIGGFSPIHQHCRIGESAMVGGMTGCRLDVPPYFIADGSRAKIRGVNVVGLKRRGIKQEVRTELTKAYKIIYLSELNTNNALEKIEKELVQYDEIKKLVTFFKTTKRGVTKGTIDKGSEDNVGSEE